MSNAKCRQFSYVTIVFFMHQYHPWHLFISQSCDMLPQKVRMIDLSSYYWDYSRARVIIFYIPPYDMVC